jgi:hypothetical protein
MLTDKTFKDPLWILSAKIADALSYCGPIKKLKVGDYETKTNFIFGFEHARATEIVHRYLEEYELTKSVARSLQSK